MHGRDARDTLTGRIHLLAVANCHPHSTDRLP